MSQILLIPCVMTMLGLMAAFSTSWLMTLKDSRNRQISLHNRIQIGCVVATLLIAIGYMLLFIIEQIQKL